MIRYHAERPDPRDVLDDRDRHDLAETLYARAHTHAATEPATGLSTDEYGYDRAGCWFPERDGA